MNNKGQLGIIFGIMMFMFAFVTATILTEPLKEMIDISRDAEHLDCSANNLTTGTAATCLVVDISLPAFISTVILVGIGAIFYGSRIGAE